MQHDTTTTRHDDKARSKQARRERQQRRTRTRLGKREQRRKANSVERLGTAVRASRAARVVEEPRATGVNAGSEGSRGDDAGNHGLGRQASSLGCRASAVGCREPGNATVERGSRAAIRPGIGVFASVCAILGGRIEGDNRGTVVDSRRHPAASDPCGRVLWIVQYCRESGGGSRWSAGCWLRTWVCWLRRGRALVSRGSVAVG